MSTPTDTQDGARAPGPACLTEEVLEEYAVRSLDSARAARSQVGLGNERTLSPEVEGHLEMCAECRRRLETAKEDAAFLRGVLELETRPTQKGCPTDEDLARYIDDSLEAECRARTEHHMAGCRSCTRRLILLFEEAQAASAPPTKEDLTIPVSLAEARAKLAAWQAASVQTRETEKIVPDESIPDEGDDTEERKKRYSSQSS